VRILKADSLLAVFYVGTKKRMYTDIPHSQKTDNAKVEILLLLEEQNFEHKYYVSVYYTLGD